MDIKIRQENKGDFANIYKLISQAFGQENEAKLVDLLRNSDAYIPELSIVATIDSNIAGHILFTKIRIIDDQGHEYQSLALAPMAVSPEYQKKGIGGRLIRAGLDKARQMKFKSVIVLGHDDYYPKFGFVQADRWNIKAPFDVPTNVFMGIELDIDALQNVSGIVKYPKEFDMI